MEIKEEKVISQTVKVSNADDSTRGYNISAEVSVREGRAENINSGTVLGLEDNVQKATFNAGAWQPLGVNFSSNDISKEEQQSIFAEIQEFCGAVDNKYR